MIRYRDHYSKTLGSLWQSCRDAQALNNGDIVAVFYANNGATHSLKYLSNFWETFEITLNNREINLILISFENCVILNTSVTNQLATFAKTDTKHIVPIVTLSTQDNAKLLQQLKCEFNLTINLNKYYSKATMYIQNQYLDYLTDSSFQGINSLFVLSYEDNANRTSYRQYFLSTVEIKDYNVMIDGRNFSDQPVKNDIETYENI